MYKKSIFRMFIHRSRNILIKHKEFQWTWCSMIGPTGVLEMENLATCSCLDVKITWYITVLKHNVWTIHFIWYSAFYSFHWKWPPLWSKGRALASHAGDWGLIFRSGQTKIVNTGIDNFTAKRSATCMLLTGPQRWPLKRVGQCHSIVAR